MSIQFLKIHPRLIEVMEFFLILVKNHIKRLNKKDLQTQIRLIFYNIYIFNTQGD